MNVSVILQNSSDMSSGKVKFSYIKKVIVRCRVVNEIDPEYKIYIRKAGIKIKNWFSIITIGVIVMAYMIFWIERDSFAFVENCIT